MVAHHAPEDWDASLSVVLAPESNWLVIQEGAPHHITPCGLPSTVVASKGKFLHTGISSRASDAPPPGSGCTGGTTPKGVASIRARPLLQQLVAKPNNRIN